MRVLIEHAEVGRVQILKWTKRYKDLGRDAFSRTPRRTTPEQNRLLRGVRAAFKEELRRRRRLDGSGKPRRHVYGPGFKLAIVRAYLKGVRAPMLRKETGVHQVIIYGWVRRFRQFGSKAFR
jgi:Helix-turn-helix domain